MIKIIRTILLIFFWVVAMLLYSPSLTTSSAGFFEGKENKVLTPKEYAQILIHQNFGDPRFAENKQWGYFDELVTRESNWDSQAQNPQSTAFGSCQFLNSTWDLVGFEKTSAWGQQLEACILYIIETYNDPAGALSFHNNNNYY